MMSMIKKTTLAKFIVLTTVIASASSNKCHACFDEICYSKTKIVNENSFTGQLAVDRSENIVYFHYRDKYSVDHTDAFDLDDIRVVFIPGIDFSFARAVDQTSREVYISGEHGIYKYNPIENTTRPFGLFDKTIWHMQFKNKVFYTILATKGLFTMESKQSRLINPLSDYIIDDFIIDNKDDIYFLSENKVYRLKKGGNSATLFANSSYSLAIDKNEVAHFMHSEKRGLYKLDEKTDSLVEVGAFGIGLPIRFVFDNNNNIIYHEHHSKQLFYLMPRYHRCKVSYNRARSKMNLKKVLKKTGKDDVDLGSSYLVFSQVS